jgi:hypothetical protein
MDKYTEKFYMDIHAVVLKARMQKGGQVYWSIQSTRHPITLHCHGNKTSKTEI